MKDFLKKDLDLLKRLLATAKTPLKDATAVNATRWKLFNTLKVSSLPVTTGSGGLTKFNRTRLNLPKEHWIDAACVGVVENLQFIATNVLRVKCTGMGGRQKCQTDKCGYPQKYRPLKPIHGFSTGDIVEIKVTGGKNKGRYIARLCPYTNGSCEIYPTNGVIKRIGSKLQNVIRSVHRKDGYSYA